MYVVVGLIRKNNKSKSFLSQLFIRKRLSDRNFLILQTKLSVPSPVCLSDVDMRQLSLQSACLSPRSTVLFTFIQSLFCYILSSIIAMRTHDFEWDGR